nr:hypothetical protein [Pandoravirus aubagnensis]
MTSILQRSTQITPPPSASRPKPPPRKASSKILQPRAEATPVAAARVHCAYPIVLTLRANPAAGEASWMSGPPSKPVVRYGGAAYPTFDAIVKAMTASPAPTVRQRHATSKTTTTSVDARSSLDARVTLSRPGQEDDGAAITVTTVALSDLLDAVTRYGRTATHICVARTASWVSQALTRQILSAPIAAPRRQPSREPSDMERMMRRLDRIVSEVASDMRLTDAVNLTHESSDNDNDDIDIVIVDTPGALPASRARPPLPLSSTIAPAALASAPKNDSALAGTTATTTTSSSSSASPTTSTQSQEPTLRPARRTTRKRQAPTPTTSSPPDAETSRPTKRSRHSTTRVASSAPQPSMGTTSSSSSTSIVSHDTIVIDDDHHSDHDGGSDHATQVFAATCAIGLVPCAEAPGIECSICMRDDGTVLWDTAMGRPATLHDLWIDPGRSALTPDGVRLKDDAIVVNPCRNVEHAVCVGCMRAVLLNPGRPPVGLDRAAVGCVSLDGESRCAATSYGEAHVFGAVLEPPEAAHLTALYERHRFPGMEVVPCPLHIVVDRPAQPTRRRGPRVDVLPCGAECMIEHTSASNAVRGHLVIACTQNPRCAGSFCYHCRSRLPAGATRCGRCVRVSERDNPDGVNRYFCRPALVASANESDVAGTGSQPAWLASGGGADAHLLRNREVTEEVAVDQIERVLSMDRVAQPCYRCGVPLLKSTECNGLSHCGVQKCYMCGRNALAGGHLEPDHWDADGSTGCPRYDHHAYWRRMKAAPFVCSEGRCYNDAAECKVPAHRAGIEAMHAERRVWHVWGMLRSLSHDLGERVMARLRAATGPGDDTRSLVLARVAKTLAQEAALARSTGAGNVRL